MTTNTNSLLTACLFRQVQAAINLTNQVANSEYEFVRLSRIAEYLSQRLRTRIYTSNPEAVLRAGGVKPFQSFTQKTHLLTSKTVSNGK